MYIKDIEVLIDEKEKDNTEDNIYVVVEDTYNEDSKTAAQERHGKLKAIVDGIIG